MIGEILSDYSVAQRRNDHTECHQQDDHTSSRAENRQNKESQAVENTGSEPADAKRKVARDDGPTITELCQGVATMPPECLESSSVLANSLRSH